MRASGTEGGVGGDSRGAWGLCAHKEASHQDEGLEVAFPTSAPVSRLTLEELSLPSC